MLTHEEIVSSELLLEKVASLLPRGYRFVTMTCVDCGDHFDILYHFDLNYELYNLRLKLGKTEALPSITPVCFAALLTENEIQDLYGIKVNALVLDYHGRLYLSEGAPDKPLCRVPGVSVSQIVKPAADAKAVQS